MWRARYSDESRIGGTRNLADIFLSYARDDKGRVGDLVRHLRAAGLDVWWDDDIPPDAPWEATIEQALASARTVVVCWSERSVLSDNVRAEARRAKAQGKLIQVFIDRCDPPLFFGERQGIEMVDEIGGRADPAFDLLVTRLRSAAPAPSAPSVREKPLVAASGPRVGRRGLLVGGGALAVVGAGAGGWIWWHQASATPGDASIAVMPFANLSGDPAQAYFSDGIAEELRSALGSLPRIRVIGRMSSEKLRDDDAVDAAKKLNVANILTGSVRRSPSLIRVSAQLIDGATGVQRWSKTYDRAPGDMLSIQSGIAQNVAQSLSIALGVEQAAAITAGSTANAAAHDLYLKARAAYLSKGTPDDVNRVLALLDAAIALDPRYADAFMLRARAQAYIGGTFDTTAAASRASYAKAAETARHAIALAPNAAAAHATLASILADQLLVKEALAEYQRAATLDPSDARFLQTYSGFLSLIGRWDEAASLSAKAVAADPLNLVIQIDRVGVLIRCRRYDQAIAAARAILRETPQQAEARGQLAQALLLSGQVREAKAEIQQVTATYVIVLVTRAAIASRLGDVAGSDSVLATLAKTSGDSANYQYAQIYAQRGEPEKAFAALDRAWQVRDAGLLQMKNDQYLDPLHADPRFAALVAKIGFP